MNDSSSKQAVTIIGAGLAGSEAAWQLARRGIPVRLHEMRPLKMTPAHNTGNCAELVCSNTFRADHLENAVGLLHEEMRRMDSLIMQCGDAARIPAGTALAVDREQFSELVTATLKAEPLIEFVPGEVTEIPAEGLVLIASGPLTSDALYEQIRALTGEEHLSFFDAIAPVVDAESVNMALSFWKNRYDKDVAEGEAGDYLNCPMTESQYKAFIAELVAADKVAFKGFEDVPFFDGCMPIEEMAERGEDTPRFGPMKPVGLDHPETGVRHYAVVQLRRDNRMGSLLNMVGFQTKMTYGEQKRVFTMIPGLEQAEFFRLGSLHRNTFIKSPALLDGTLRLKKQPRILFAGQITGVEGYVESAAMGLMAGRFLAAMAQGLEPDAPPADTAHGALLAHISQTRIEDFQPMNINFGLLPPGPKMDGKRRLGRADRRRMVSDLALASLQGWLDG
ncbi:MAG: methylenetetrahydrofolate--tRNA-(uracil(54)-C(5))-methyltransferase (FADH(2)-oxidizing) TrmFO [Zetaproteobacteria bacterium CG12_big_fil_rev_8_21_14_0_65_55_1124]|nr:MAG: methylenetetrahydrofolate--tRNA-(uracil(54)-C(5))-methyltransferase (FADH(2)-oxidizing) TrmFO [Zetaproteobacteria bacterium CG1_02_55_237]PIS19075.1 MAG: methylenetetrahydrofolate--tRNA-(uracil(54)-C(5))-methyltransferase (FADH(2)-oxidizing) TrmFO [Zetaproteobacteria bacterium CG08_land_8_20_14_0_20_55_17]PIW41952.1 MAG: methylenetetrahydrofolate--tRNA-(uracil(54)-C(5))-methyltransferase (FADH(2)-oxidizing) TrmFO [Zetaproteobacteria bacterium CG12_big_fil_rev_8_21_14_0_65_55_1124]PIY5140